MRVRPVNGRIHLVIDPFGAVTGVSGPPLPSLPPHMVVALPVERVPEALLEFDGDLQNWRVRRRPTPEVVFDPWVHPTRRVRLRPHQPVPRSQRLSFVDDPEPAGLLILRSREGLHLTRWIGGADDLPGTTVEVRDPSGRRLATVDPDDLRPNRTMRIVSDYSHDEVVVVADVRAVAASVAPKQPLQHAFAVEGGDFHFVAPSPAAILRAAHGAEVPRSIVEMSNAGGWTEGPPPRKSRTTTVRPAALPDAVLLAVHADAPVVVRLDGEGMVPLLRRIPAGNGTLILADDTVGMRWTVMFPGPSVGRCAGFVPPGLDFAPTRGWMVLPDGSRHEFPIIEGRTR